jgi:hypothetical protein
VIFSQIQELEAGPLSDLEREIVRQILNISGTAGNAVYLDSEARMTLLTPPQRQVVRALILDYDDIGLDTTKAQGLGRDYDPERDKEKIASELRRMLYPSAANDPTTANNSGYQPSGTIFLIPVSYKVGSDELS